MSLEQSIFRELEERAGREHLMERLQIQVEHSAEVFGRRRNLLHWENFTLFKIVLQLLLGISGLSGRGKRNVWDFHLREVEVSFEDLPRSFLGFSILHLSDLHIESLKTAFNRLKEIIGAVRFDLCVITGDFRYETYGDYNSTLELLEEFTGRLACEYGILGVLGNHDFIETLPALEEIGIRMLLNESVPIRRGAETISLVGVDDPHFYCTDDLKKSLKGLPLDQFKILLAHSPEILRQAEVLGINYYLCGHTHGGQICLPGGIPIVTNTVCKRKYLAGPWRYKGMSGYTSRGTGASIVPVRLLCPPEIVVHRLKRK